MNAIFRIVVAYGVWTLSAAGLAALANAATATIKATAPTRDAKRNMKCSRSKCYFAHKAVGM